MMDASATDRVQVIVDGRTAEVPRGTTVLQAARNAGIDIPTMCEHEKLAGFGACRLCQVELVKGKRSRVVGLVDAPGQRFVFSLFDTDEIWSADFSQGNTPVISRFSGATSGGTVRGSPSPSFILAILASGSVLLVHSSFDSFLPLRLRSRWIRSSIVGGAYYGRHAVLRLRTAGPPWGKRTAVQPWAEWANPSRVEYVDPSPPNITGPCAQRIRHSHDLLFGLGTLAALTKHRWNRTD